MEARVRMARDTQHALARRRRLGGHRMVQEAPLPFVRQAPEPVHHALAADAGELVDRGMSGRRMKRSTPAAPASSATAALSIAEAPAPTTPTRFPASAAKSISSAECAQVPPVDAGDEIGTKGPPSASLPVARTNRRARTDVGVGTAALSSTMSSSRRSAPNGRIAVTRVSFRTGRPRTRRYQARDIHPLPARDFSERVPGGKAEPGLVPGAKRKRRKAECRAGELLGQRSVRIRAKVSQGPSSPSGA